MRIQNNIMAMNTHRQLGINNLNQTKSTEKLSSGYRINRAADDAAGLSISEKMRAQIRGLNMASANAQDGISLVQAAEGALQETHNILQRMRELAVKAANDVNQNEDRGAIMKEIAQLTSEVDRIAFTTEFNKKTLLDGSLQNGVLSARTISGFNVATGIVATAGTTATGTHTVAVTTAAKQWSNSFDCNVIPGTLEEGNLVSFDLTEWISGAAATSGVAIFTYEATGNAEVDSAAITNGLKAALDAKYGDLFDITSTNSKITITAKEAGAIADVLGVALATGITAITATTVQGSAAAAPSANAYGLGTSAITNTVAAGANAVVSVDGAALVVGTNATFNNGVYSVTAGAANGLSFRINDTTRLSTAVVNVSTGKSMTFQVGANTGSDQTVALGIKALSAAGLGIDFLNVSTHLAAQSAVDSIEKAIGIVSDQRSALGAVQNRLEHTVANLDTVSENLQAAESRIRDVDMAKEMMNFTKNNILTQAATAMLAQANQAPQTVLQLLR